MRPVVIAANWKMNTTPADAGELARTIASRTRVPGVTRVICPPFVSLAAVRDALAAEDVGVGAQNVHHELAGAFTGEVSVPMLAGLATWVILGHSERRAQAGETDELIGRKLDRAVAAGLRPILCVGEVLEEREAGREVAVVDGQLRGSLAGRDPGALADAGLVIAYEPVWAIGTGRNARGADAAAMADAIRAGARGPRLGRGSRRRPRPVRRQRHVREHRGVPRGARHRRRARRRGVAQARRDGRHRRPGRDHGRGPRPRRVTEPDPASASRDGRPRPIVLVVLDGFGIGRDPAADAIAAAPMPRWRGLLARWPHSVLQASEGAVGLPVGQMGNSEVGHLNLGAGRPVLQDLPRIDAAIRDGSFEERPALLAACERARETGRAAHRRPGRAGRRPRPRPAPARAGPDGGARRACRRSASTRCSTAATRRRPRRWGSSATSRRELAAAHPDARIASVGGRYWAMDRDQRWERVERGYDAIVHGVGEHAASATRRDRGGVRARRDRRVRRPDRDRRHRRPAP